MPVDEAFLAAHRCIERPATGVREEFLDVELGAAATVATLYGPLAADPTTGWVICHSFGMEQTFLMEHEVAVARSMAAAGHAALRYQGQGYGESAGDPTRIGLASHLADAADAVRLMAGRRGIEQVGIMGGRFGGLIAALTAEREGLPLMVMWEPVTSGARFMRSLLRTRVIFDVGRAEGERAPADPLRELEQQGWTDVKGSVLTAEAHRDISAVDLRRDVRRFRGHALVVSASRSGSASLGAARLAEHLREIGAHPDALVVRDDEGGNFGAYHYGSVNDPDTKVDLQAELQAKLAEATAAWCRQRGQAASGPTGRKELRT